MAEWAGPLSPPRLSPLLCVPHLPLRSQAKNPPIQSQKQTAAPPAVALWPRSWPAPGVSPGISHGSSTCCRGINALRGSAEPNDHALNGAKQLQFHTSTGFLLLRQGEGTNPFLKISFQKTDKKHRATEVDVDLLQTPESAAAHGSGAWGRRR